MMEWGAASGIGNKFQESNSAILNALIHLNRVLNNLNAAGTGILRTPLCALLCPFLFRVGNAAQITDVVDLVVSLLLCDQ